MLLVELAQQTVPFDLPEHIKLWSNPKKLEWLLQLVDPLVTKLFLPFKEPSMEKIPVSFILNEQVVQLEVPAKMQGKTLDVVLDNNILEIPVPTRDIPVVQDTDDELGNYTHGFLRSMMDFIVLGDIIAAGDINRLTPMLKRLIPLFVGLSSYRSKYAIECVNFLTKTEWVLSERESVKAKLRAFVNTSGTPGRNKPADMQQENNIKTVKGVVKGLGASKTADAMVRVSKAAPAVSSMAEGFQEGMGLTLHSGTFQHHKKDSSEDKHLVQEILQEIRPFTHIPHREIGMSASSSFTHTVNSYDLIDFIKRNAARAVNQCDFSVEDN